MIWPLWLACSNGPNHDVPDEPGTISTTPTSTSVPSPTTYPRAELGVADADFELPAELFTDTYEWGFQVIPDVGADGADDLVATLWHEIDGFYCSDIHSGRAVWPDILTGASAVLLDSPVGFVNDDCRYEGVANVLATPDATGDGVPDVWVRDAKKVSHLLPGPLDRNVWDPKQVSEATSDAWQWMDLAADLDGDGVGGVSIELDARLAWCEGPFAGEIHPETCPAIETSLGGSMQAIGHGDLDADGVQDLVVAVTALASMLLVYDGVDVSDGATDPVLTVVPTPQDFRSRPEQLVVLDDLDGDGLGDLAWVEIDDSGGAVDPGEVAILHGPTTPGAELSARDATLHLEGIGGRVVIDGVVHGADVAPSLVLVHDTTEPVADFVALLADASVRGAVDPAETGLFLASDGAVTTDGWTWADADVGDFDADGLDDVVVLDLIGSQGWIYLGASLP